MKDIQSAFKNGKAFIGFVTGGDPTPEKSAEFILEMERAGADMIEIGIPFSDPVAEGAVIQEASIRALKSGTTTDRVFDIASAVRKRSDIPLALMTYLNPVFKYGYDRFFARCAEFGICGVIIPDLPYEEKDEVQSVAVKYGTHVISLIAPTSDERIKMIASAATGFIYVVSSKGVTGVRSEFQTDLKALMNAVKASAKVPAAIGFGVSTPEQAREIAKLADGVIVGSAIVKIIAEYGTDSAPHIYEYVKSMKDAIR